MKHEVKIRFTGVGLESLSPIHTVAWLAFLFILLSGCASIRESSDSQGAQSDAQDSLWFREELYFGSDIPTGGIVSDSLWEDFVNSEIVSRFPDGFTTLPAMGRYKYKTGEIKKEPTRIIIIYYPPQLSSDSAKIQEIIELYKKKFVQESVLRVRSRTEAEF